PSLGECSTSSYRRGLPRLCPSDSIRMRVLPRVGHEAPSWVLIAIICLYRAAAQHANKCLLKSHDPAGQLQIVTYTGGRKRDGGTPVPGERISCMASGVDRKRRSELAAVLRLCRSCRVAFQHASPGAPGRSTRASAPRRSCWATRCSTAGATPAPSAAAAHAAVWFGNTPIRSSGICNAASSWPVALPGSVPDGPTSQRHCCGLPRRRDCPAETTTRRYRKIGSLTTGSPG